MACIAAEWRYAMGALSLSRPTAAQRAAHGPLNRFTKPVAHTILHAAIVVLTREFSVTIGNTLITTPPTP
jgi:hypothetical protein